MIAEMEKTRNSVVNRNLEVELDNSFNDRGDSQNQKGRVNNEGNWNVST